MLIAGKFKEAGIVPNFAIYLPNEVCEGVENAFAQDRLYYCKFSGEFSIPVITVEPLDVTSSNIEIITFHLEKVVKKNKIGRRMKSMWADMALRPHDILDIVLPSGSVSSNDVQAGLSKLDSHSTAKYGTQNNWESIFYFGLARDISRVTQLANVINSKRKLMKF